MSPILWQKKLECSTLAAFTAQSNICEEGSNQIVAALSSHYGQVRAMRKYTRKLQTRNKMFWMHQNQLIDPKFQCSIWIELVKFFSKLPGNNKRHFKISLLLKLLRPFQTLNKQGRSEIWKQYSSPNLCIFCYCQTQC